MTTLADLLKPHDCAQCGVTPGSLHQDGCSIERCVLCGGQAIGCNCVHEINGLSVDDLEETRPDVYMNGSTPAMCAKRDAAEAAVGGRLPWTGVWPGVVECIEFGWFSKFVEGVGWHPSVDLARAPVGVTAESLMADGYEPDLNRLASRGRWDVAARKWTK